MKIYATIMMCLLLALSGCGKRAALDAPDGADPKYPRQYPAPQK